MTYAVLKQKHVGLPPKVRLDVDFSYGGTQNASTELEAEISFKRRKGVERANRGAESLNRLTKDRTVVEHTSAD